MNDRHAISPYPVRMPGELRKRLDESAREGSRSLHAEIISRLEESFASRDTKQMGMGELADLLIEMGREKGLSVEVTFSQPSDESEQSGIGDTPLTTSISKEKLMASLAKGNSEEPGVSEAIRRAYEAIQALDVLVGSTSSSKGPKPRKKFPKE